MQELLSNSFGGLMLFIWLLVVPVLMGIPFAGIGSEDRKHIRTAWICGYMEMWAIFQIVAMIFVLTTREFSHVVNTYIGACVLVCLLGLFIGLKKRRAFRLDIKSLWSEDKERKVVNIVLWTLSIAVVLVQIYKSVTMAFADGDDAYYIPISASTVASGKLYNSIPYDGYPTTLDMRHALAPFPVWIAFLSQVSGIHSTIIAHTILPPVLILVTYSIYYRMGYMLFKKNRDGVPIFMLLVGVLITYGNYSFYTVETFMLTRTGQGKSVLGNIVIPFIMLCLLQMGQEFTSDEILASGHRRPSPESNKRKILLGILVTTATVASWLCSTMGAILTTALVGLCGVIIFLTYKNIKAIAYAFACCIPSILFLLGYLVIT